jgi:hypothetical protein
MVGEGRERAQLVVGIEGGDGKGVRKVGRGK